MAPKCEDCPWQVLMLRALGLALSVVGINCAVESLLLVEVSSRGPAKGREEERRGGGEREVVGRMSSSVVPESVGMLEGEKDDELEAASRPSTAEEVESIVHTSRKFFKKNSKLIMAFGVMLVVCAMANLVVESGDISRRLGTYNDAFKDPRWLTYNRRNFLLNKKQFRLLSGSMDYFRTLPAHWPIVLRKLKATGLNTVTTGVPWNLHEPEPSLFVFGGILNLTQFLLDCKDAGLMVILKPGPFVGSDLDFGGLPGELKA